MTVLENIINNASKLKIAVIGDYIEDRYIIGDVDRISPEAPVPVVKVTSQRYSPGGAGNVFMNLKGIGVDAAIFCNMAEVHNDLPHSFNWFCQWTNHCVKTRVMSGNHHLIRFDHEVVTVDRDWSAVSWAKTFEILLPTLDCVVISDYSKGVISEDVAETIICRCKKYNVPVVVDAKRGFSKYVDATILKCNGKEWASSPYRDSKEFVIQANIQTLIITHGGNGMEMQRSNLWNSWPAIKVPIADTCGAGDTVTAILGVCEALRKKELMDDITMDDLIRTTNRLAAEVCKHPGVYAIQRDDLIKINDEQREKVL
jgi:rfaE bifunctional protein kinase chain/domain